MSPPNDLDHSAYGTTPTELESSQERFEQLLEQIKKLSEMTPEEHFEQAICFAYRNLACSTNHKPVRSAFKKRALRDGWTEERFEAWANQHEWQPNPIIPSAKDRQLKWDRRYVDLAKTIASWSKDPSTQVGAVIVAPDGSIVSVGYNGFPRGVDDSPERLNDRETKYKMIVHAERNAMLFAQRALSKCTLYTWPFLTCAVCAGMAIQAGIVRCVAPLNDNPRWVADFDLSKQMFKEAGVDVTFLEVM